MAFDMNMDPRRGSPNELLEWSPGDLAGEGPPKSIPRRDDMSRGVEPRAQHVTCADTKDVNNSFNRRRRSSPPITTSAPRDTRSQGFIAAFTCVKRPDRSERRRFELENRRSRTETDEVTSVHRDPRASRRAFASNTRLSNASTRLVSPRKHDPKASRRLLHA